MILLLQELFIYALIIGVFAFISLCVILKLISNPKPIIRRSKNEKYFKDINGEQILFSSLADKSTIHLSVIVPAYNEEKRLPPMLDECLEFLEDRSKTKGFLYEVIVVSDGSSDKTVDVAFQYTKKFGDKVRVLGLETNRGKGGAVRLGMLSARGALLLFADADGATKFSDLSKLEDSIEKITKCDYKKEPNIASESLAIINGSRAHLEENSVATRSFFRTILMYGFHFLVRIFTVSGIKDTQCGFKLLTRRTATICFNSMHVESWAFDVELLYIAQYLKIPLSEVAVNWTEIEGSKITPVWSWIQMGKDLMMIWLRYNIGAWKLPQKIE